MYLCYHYAYAKRPAGEEQSLTLVCEPCYVLLTRQVNFPRFNSAMNEGQCHETTDSGTHLT
jgi:hypothetical protein